MIKEYKEYLKLSGHGGLKLILGLENESIDKIDVMVSEFCEKLEEWDMLINNSFDMDIDTTGITFQFWGPNYKKLDNQKLEILKNMHKLLDFHILNEEAISKLIVNLKSEDNIFKIIEKTFLNNFDCKLINKEFELEVDFLHLSDYLWFKDNIAYPKDLNEDEMPIYFISSRALMGNWPSTSTCEYIVFFRIRNLDKLLEMVNQKNSL